MGKATGTFTVIGGSELTNREATAEPRITGGSGTQRFGGSIVERAPSNRSSAIEPIALPVHRPAAHRGLRRWATGTVVIESTGDHDGKAPKGRWLVIRVGDGELVGIAGEGSFDAPGGPKSATSSTTDSTEPVRATAGGQSVCARRLRRSSRRRRRPRSGAGSS